MPSTYASLFGLLGADLVPWVLSQLTPPDLFALCLVSKESKELAEPYLYSTLRWKWDRDHFPPIVPFLRTVMAKPALGACTVTLDLQGAWNNIMWTGRAEHPVLHDKLLDRCFSPEYVDSSVEVNAQRQIDQMSGLDATFAEEWKLDITSRCMDAYVALLVSQLPNLRHFQIDGDFVRDNKLLSMMFRLALIDNVAGLPRFKHLKEVRHAPLFTRRYYEGLHTDEGILYFHLPSLETLLVALDEPVGDSWAADLPKSSTIRHLKIAQCAEGQLKHVLQSTPKLLSFSWEYFWDEDSPSDRTGMLNFRVLQEALSPFYLCLRHLALTARFNGDPFGDFDALQFKGDIYWIKSFVHLRHFTVDIAPLRNAMTKDPTGVRKLLPDSLKTLELLHDLSLVPYLSMVVADAMDDDSEDLVGKCVHYFNNWRDISPDLDISLAITDLGFVLEKDELTRIEDAARMSTFEVRLTKHPLWSTEPLYFY